MDGSAYASACPNSDMTWAFVNNVASSIDS